MNNDKKTIDLRWDWWRFVVFSNCCFPTIPSALVMSLLSAVCIWFWTVSTQSRPTNRRIHSVTVEPVADFGLLLGFIWSKNCFHPVEGERTERTLKKENHFSNQWDETCHEPVDWPHSDLGEGITLLEIWTKPTNENSFPPKQARKTPQHL